MKALLSIQLVEKPEDVLFKTSYEEQVKQYYPDVTHFSLDNFSQVSMIEYALELVQRSESLLIVIESSNGETSPNKLTSLINHLVRKRFDNMKLIMLGEHPAMEKMGKALGEKFDFQPNKEKILLIADHLFS
ncbi:hypothetical protein [Catalinimonas niigatensis]|uniref:hypothetical protein n=1 Tax=Catalinimonas niigatensis TaxID=1397264 RepID=UPI002666FDC3|nr:hypothetical protein [Catalinimonas niigatensis]WPP48066.1 hypothetical protein PZB72_15445 [Catalinimonas niigatensis]